MWFCTRSGSLPSRRCERCFDFSSSLRRSNVSRFEDAASLELTSFFAYSDVTPLRLNASHCIASIDDTVVFDSANHIYASFVLSPTSTISFSHVP